MYRFLIVGLLFVLFFAFSITYKVAATRCADSGQKFSAFGGWSCHD
jgi:hypothetical protein